MFQTQKDKLDAAIRLNLKSITLYTVIGKYGNKLPEEVINSLRKDAEDYQKESERLAGIVAKNLIHHQSK